MKRDEETVFEIKEMLMNEFKLVAAGLRPHDFDPSCQHCIDWKKRFAIWAEDRARHIVGGYGEG